LLFERIAQRLEFDELYASASPGNVGQFRCLEQDPALTLQTFDGGQQREPAALDQIGRRLGTQLAIDHAQFHRLTQTKHAVFKQFDLGKDPRLAPFEFQIIQSAVEFQVETAHG
jgi:hypothetical protein